MFEGITCVYRSNVDLYFYVFGSSSENEVSSLATPALPRSLRSHRGLRCSHSPLTHAYRRLTRSRAVPAASAVDARKCPDGALRCRQHRAEVSLPRSHYCDVAGDELLPVPCGHSSLFTVLRLLAF